MKIIFVADNFVKDFPQGGSEQSLQAIIDAAPEWAEIVECVRSRDFSMATKYECDLMIFGNIANMPMAYLPRIAARYKYAVIESDFKACSFRSPDAHKQFMKRDCDCHASGYGRIVAQFYAGAQAIFWKSKRQMDWYLDRYAHLAENLNTVLSCTIAGSELDAIAKLRKARRNPSGWAVLKVDNWIKAYDEVVAYCNDKGLKMRPIAGLNRQDTFKALAKCEGVVFHPRGMDTCPRFVVESKLLGLKLDLNDNICCQGEEWFDGPIDGAEAYLRTRVGQFWGVIESIQAEAPVMGEVVA